VFESLRLPQGETTQAYTIYEAGSDPHSVYLALVAKGEGIDREINLWLSSWTHTLLLHSMPTNTNPIDSFTVTIDFLTSVNLQISSTVPSLSYARDVPFLNIYLSRIVLQSFRFHAEI